MVDLIATKLHVPPPRSGYTMRPRISALLEGGASKPLTLVSAPAGFGKTTAVSAWVHECDREAAWLSIDSGDNDASRFWTYFVASLQTIEPGFGHSVLALLRSPQPPAPESFLALLINDAAALKRQLTIVLEDYHEIENSDIHDAVSYLLGHMPSNMRIVIISREDPPLQLARLRGGDALAEIRARELRFTEDEAGAYLKSASGLDISAADLAALESRTEGWVAGLQMAALSMQGRADITEFVQSLTGTHRFILDYLAEEVLQRQPQDVQAFLMETSILERLTGPLCDAVTGRADSRRMLEELENRNLFVVPLDDERRWYRYHHLFAEFLRSFLEERTSFGDIQALHDHASEWLACNAFPADAIWHALVAKNFDRAAELVEEFARDVLWRDAQHRTVDNWLNSVPTEVIESRPRLCILQAWTRFTTGQWDGVEPLLKRAETTIGLLGDPLRDELLGEVCTIRSGIAYETGDMGASIELAEEALNLLPEEAGTVRAIAAFQLGLGSSFADDPSAAREAFADAVSISREADNIAIALLSYGCQAQLAVLDGRLNEAADLYAAAMRIGRTETGALLPPAGLACVQMGEVLRERNQLDEAEIVLREGIALCSRQGGMPEHMLTGHIILARVLDASGRAAAAEEEVRRADEIEAELRSRPGDVTSIIAQAMEYGARLLLGRGDRDGVDHLLEAARFSSADASSAMRCTGQLLLARCLIARHRHEGAIDVLEHTLATLRDAARPGVRAEALVLLAEAWLKLGRHSEAADHMKRGLKEAQAEGYVRLFVEDAESIRELLSRCSPEESYAVNLLSAFSDHASANGDDNDLTERELAVLRSMAAGLSNGDIAAELYLSLNTVKWHARHIYEKLGVRNRSAAVARARELSIL